MQFQDSLPSNKTSILKTHPNTMKSQQLLTKSQNSIFSGRRISKGFSAMFAAALVVGLGAGSIHAQGPYYPQVNPLGGGTFEPNGKPVVSTPDLNAIEAKIAVLFPTKTIIIPSPATKSAASVAEYAGIPVRIIAGDHDNRKLTTSEDIEIANAVLSQKMLSDRPDIRTGQGIDFHIFAAGKAVTLLGVVIPHTHKLKGHSDADVAMHALTDAILGAIGEGDIGTHFPPTDMQWKNAASSIFLKKAVDLLLARSGILANVDITILAEAPKINPHIQEMKAVLSTLLHISPDRIAVKATTTEKLGAIGRKEGMAAFATVTVRLPL